MFIACAIGGNRLSRLRFQQPFLVQFNNQSVPRPLVRWLRSKGFSIAYYESVSETLEDIDSNIATLEELKASKVSSANRIAFHLIFYASILYVTVVVISYFLIRPSETQGKVVFTIFIVLYPFTIWSICGIWGVQIERKRLILEDVMSKETYNKTQQLLKRFDPLGLIVRDNLAQQDARIASLEAEAAVRLRHDPSTLTVQNTLRTPQPGMQTPQFSKPPHAVEPTTTQPVKGPITHRPILPRHRSILDVVFDALVGDGPDRRYALICQQCSGHNGMALAEEFEYIAFRCCYCGFHNPAHRTRRTPSGVPRMGPFPSSPDSPSAMATPITSPAERRLQSTSALNLTSVGHLQLTPISASTENVFAEPLHSRPSRRPRPGRKSLKQRSELRSSSSSVVDLPEEENKGDT
ncbi:Endoplasmic reticulum junction formation protein lunapark [Taenia crassiceps]|uniref:Endoplasmic reticulum junction formation protein lunapark n=1 Tax=Taenia crassiceps TaxID=6207 RepID=A0ABR4QM87_9CEST